MIVYADNAATTRTSDRAVQAMLPYFTTEFGNPSSLHTHGQNAKEALETARESVAQALGCTPREIYFTSGGTESDNMAIRTAAYFGARKNKRHIISTTFEHHAVLHTLKRLENEGFEVTLLDVGPMGTVTAKQVRDAIREDTALVTIMYANNEIGSILPIRQIGEVCRACGVLFHTDAVQAVGHLPMDVAADHVDLLSLSGHKFHGPKGVGALYIRKGIPPMNVLEGGAQERGKRPGTENLPGIMGMAQALKDACGAGALYIRKGIPPMNVLEGGAQERGKRPGTENLPGIMGMAQALKDACGALDETAGYVTALRDRLIQGLSQIPHSVLNGDPVNRLPGNVSFCFEGIEGESLLLLACCSCWTARASGPAPALPAPPAVWIPAMYCWPSADPTRSPTDLCG